MDVLSTHTASGVHSYGKSVSIALITYADGNKAFSAWLRELIVATFPEHNIHLSSVLFPTPFYFVDESYAAAKATWLVTAATQKKIPGYKDAMETLSAWAYSKERTEPQAFILGLMYGVLNYGVWGHPTKKHEPMNILVRDDVFAHTKKVKLAEVCTTLSHGIVERGLTLAQGQTKFLEPELGNWLFGEKNMVLYAGSQAALQRIENHVRSFGPPIDTIVDASGITHLALGPEIYIRDIPGYESLTAVSRM